MERTLLLIKPSTIQRGLIGEVIRRLENKGLKICGFKMMKLDDALLDEHYAHLVAKPFYPSIKKSMQSSPVIACCLEGVEAVKVVRDLTGATNGRNALAGTLRGDFCVSVLENIVHTSDSHDAASVEIKRFFREDEIFDYSLATFGYLYTSDEL